MDKLTSSTQKSSSASSQESLHDVQEEHLVLNEALVIAEGEEHLTWYMIILTLSASLAGLLFGYDTGYISGVSSPFPLFLVLAHIRPGIGFDWR